MSANKATKPGTRKDYGQVLQSAFNEQDSSLTIATFLTGKIGFKIVRTDTDAEDLDGSLAGDDFSYYDGDTLLYTLRILYSDLEKTIFTSAERVE
jgi:hypothetical protein